jgi:hypothetical protein
VPLLCRVASALTCGCTARSPGHRSRLTSPAMSSCGRRLPRFTATSGSRSSRRSGSFGSGSVSRHGSSTRRLINSGARSDEEHAALYLLVLLVTIATIRDRASVAPRPAFLARFGVRLGCCALPPKPSAKREIKGPIRCCRGSWWIAFHSPGTGRRSCAMGSARSSRSTSQSDSPRRQLRRTELAGRPPSISKAGRRACDPPVGQRTTHA